MWGTAISLAFKMLKGVKTYWIYIGAALIVVVAIIYHIVSVNALKETVLKKDLQIAEHNATITALGYETSNCKSALTSSQSSLDLVTNELQLANDKYKEFELDRIKTKQESEKAITALQNKVTKLQKDAVALKERYSKNKKSDQEILELMKEDVNKTIDAVRAINILFDKKEGGEK